jgi:16S rRNA (guanine(966)-N(2))-methyltransferase RsmD
MATRPTSDRAKEGLFNIIGPLVAGARFLDLYCGSGAIGIEALSRGASEAVFADNAGHALEALGKNLAAARIARQAEVYPLTVKEAVKRLCQAGRKFDIVFLDPPYGGELLKDTFLLLAHSSIIENGGLIVAETDTRFPIPDITPFTLEQKREYGRTRFLFCRGENV